MRPSKRLPSRPPLGRESPRPVRIDDVAGRIRWYGFSAAAGLRSGPGHDALALKGLPGDPGLLGGLTVLCIGLGAIGGALFQTLARLGLGRIFGIDPDRYGRDSWLTQPIRRLADRGRSKALVQGRLAHAINPASEVWTARAAAQDVPLWLYRMANVIILAGDNLALSLWVGNLCQALGKDLIELAVFGEGLAAFVRHFALSDPKSPCPSCEVSEAEYRTFVKSRHGCDPGTIQAAGQGPTRTQPMTCALAAQLGVAEALKAMLAVEPRQRLASEELFYSMVPHRAVRTSLGKRNPACRSPHRRWRTVGDDRGPADVTLGELIDSFDALPAAADEAGGLLQVRGEVPWVSFSVCGECGVRQAVRRFGRPGDDLGRLCRCGAALAADPLGTRSVLPAADVESCRDRPLRELGLSAGAAIGISRGDDWTYYFLGDGYQALAAGLTASSPEPRHRRRVACPSAPPHDHA